MHSSMYIVQYYQLCTMVWTVADVHPNDHVLYIMYNGMHHSMHNSKYNFLFSFMFLILLIKIWIF